MKLVWLQVDAEAMHDAAVRVWQGLIEAGVVARVEDLVAEPIPDQRARAD